CVKPLLDGGCDAGCASTADRSGFHPAPPARSESRGQVCNTVRRTRESVCDRAIRGRRAGSIGCLVPWTAPPGISCANTAALPRQGARVLEEMEEEASR